MPSEDTAARKAALRRALSATRRERDGAAIAVARAAVRDLVLARCDTARWRCVAGYVPLRTEPGSVRLLDELRRRGVRVLIPVLLADRDLDWAWWDGTDAPGPTLGRDVVAEADTVLVPALAVARDGTRLGRGGGSYDRALPRAATAVRAALIYDDELLDTLPADPWDARVSDAVTPSGWRRLVT